MAEARIRDRLAILEVGIRCLALPLSEVAYFAQAAERQAVHDGPGWLAGILARGSADAWLPVIDLAGLWHDVSLRGARTRIVVATHAGIALAVEGYTTTTVALPIIPLRPAPGVSALGHAALVDGRPIPVLDPRHLVSHDQWQSLKLTA
jgi:hypothetical protein